jgi:glutamine synthetase
MSMRDNYSLETQNVEGSLELGNPDFIQIRYTDIQGKFLAKYVCGYSEDLHDCFRKGVGVDGSSVKGFAEIDESDLLLMPDRSTLRPTPIPKFRVATVVADVYNGFGKGRFVRDPRHVTQRMEDFLTNEGFSCQIGPEVECFIFDDMVFGDGHEPEIISTEQMGSGKYPLRRKEAYDSPPFQDSLLEFRFEVARILEKYHLIKATNLNHEVATNGQIEINFMHSTLTKAADNVQTYKDVIRNVAKQHDKVANFMPKPIFDENDPKMGDNGSGMHVSASIWKKSASGSENVFYDATDDYAELSQTGRYFIGGILDHASSLAALVAPTVNSYSRMVPGFEAPVYVAWSRGNRSSILRVPINDKNNSKSKRVEFRAPDPSANPYLAFSAIMAAGIDGIRKKTDPGNPVNENIFKMSDSARSSLGIKSLPGSLKESTDALKSDRSYLKTCFSDELIECHVMLKNDEITGIKSKSQQFTQYYDV